MLLSYAISGAGNYQSDSGVLWADSVHSRGIKAENSTPKYLDRLPCWYNWGTVEPEEGHTAPGTWKECNYMFSCVFKSD